MALKTASYFVAYLDLLGGISIIEQDKDDKDLNIIFQLYDTAKVTKEHEDLDFGSLQIKIFSDNIIITQKISNTDDIIQQFVESQRINSFVAGFLALVLEK